MNRIATLVTLLLLVPALAVAEPKTAVGWYKEGANQYNLGNFDQAAKAFKKGFELETNDAKKPAYLYNIAQAYRQGNRCNRAVFFYKRFLALKSRDTAKPLSPALRTKIQGWIKELQECAKTQQAIADHPPQNTIQPGNSGDETAAGSNGTTGDQAHHGQAHKRVAANGDEGDAGNDHAAIGLTKSASAAPKLISARLVAGATKIAAGGLDVPVQPTFTVVAGYPLAAMGKLAIEPGIALGYTPVPFTNSITGSKQISTLFSVLANAGVSYEVAPKISVRGDLGLGLVVFDGLESMGNPFTEAGNAATGGLTMFALRAGVSADYAITPNVVATVAPITFSFSPAKSGLRKDIKAITRFDFMLGVGYRM